MDPVRVRVSFAVSQDDEAILRETPDGRLAVPGMPHVVSGHWTPNDRGYIVSPSLVVEVPHAPRGVARQPVSDWVTAEWGAAQARKALGVLTGCESRISSASVDIQVIG